MIRFVSLSFLCLIFTINTQAADNAPVFKAIYYSTNPDGSKLGWSAKIPGPFTNGCTAITIPLPNGTQYPSVSCSYVAGVDGELLVGNDSPAEQACEQIGGKLPTLEQYNSLFAGFDHTGSSGSPNDLSVQGMEDFESAFKDDSFNTYWTATVVNSTGNAFSFSYEYASSYMIGGIINQPRDSIKLPVRCVDHR